MNALLDNLIDAFPITLLTVATLGFVFGISRFWQRSRQKVSVERTLQVAGPRPGAFTDGNHRVCQPPELVEYKFGAREGVLADVFQDGDAVVFFRDTLRFEEVKLVYLCKLQKPARWACDYGFHLHCVTGTGIMGGGVICLGCGADPRKLSGLYNVRRNVTPLDRRRIAELREAVRNNRRYGKDLGW